MVYRVVGVNRPDAHNLWNLEVIQTVCRACKRLADAEHLRVGVIFGHGRLFTAGLDLASVAPLIATGNVSALFPEDGLDPWNFFGEPCLLDGGEGVVNVGDVDVGA